ncbi:phosphate/phosphite/phosphonate ABC transporter substrate-binding protein [Thermocoleostomius sinensis]|jgi:phosphonate transport system substrate-binding protein|uniref:PhnD/SsuA/transferrin family substrate-binding protein n=1 Tax=Thermocoleostomius sinensis A174 TaxID=2016057 RepID=A0A9E8ZHR9_9CYAN|nr:PhnD/SsuA/transferrin family substrate-binding protein [Thermocoleostomius sinensis]WAL62039.1 PhnD/SsuA/transferrin family substrate-binding protein [Thermocoleostomius sinensis A174]
MLSSRFCWSLVLFLIGTLGTSCNSQPEATSLNEITIGIVGYDEGDRSLQQYERLQTYLSEQTKAIVQIEPAYNELQAIEQIHRKQWEIVFAPPGLAAIALDQDLYLPLFALEELDSERRSLLVVTEDSPVQSLADLSNRVVALGAPGSAAGYYLPVYDLYGLTLAEARFAPTPKTALQWLSEGRVEAAALSMEDFDRYQRDFSTTSFRVLHTSRWIPPGLVLLGPTVERNLQEQIERAMRDAPPDITADAGYVPSAPLPNYDPFIELVEKVLPLRESVQQQPAVLQFEYTPPEEPPPETPL